VKPALGRYCERALRVDGHDDSPPANALGVALLEAGLPPFETQYEVVVDGRVLHLDFAWPDEVVGLEYMGKADHGIDQVDSDARRRGQLTGAGWRVLDATGGILHRDIIRWVGQALAAARRVQ
jgi:very-short-patch-repair endonuclease